MAADKQCVDLDFFFLLVGVGAFFFFLTDLLKKNAVGFVINAVFAPFVLILANEN